MTEEGMREKSLGFAVYYLAEFGEAKSENEIDIQIYAKLMEVDSRLGISAAEQLFYCIHSLKTLRLDVIKVCIQKKCF